MSHEFGPTVPPDDPEADVLWRLAVVSDEIVSRLGVAMLEYMEAGLSLRRPLADQAETYASIHDISKAHKAEIESMTADHSSNVGRCTESIGYSYMTTGKSSFFVSNPGSLGMRSLFRLS